MNEMAPHPQTLTRRGLSEAEAAVYCGLVNNNGDPDLRRFRKAIKDRLLPERLPLGKVWDRMALDASLNKMSNIKTGQRGEPGNVGKNAIRRRQGK